MPRQVENIEVADIGNGNAQVTIGPFGYTVPLIDLFDRTSMDELQIRDNCRLAYKIGNYGKPNSLEYLNAVNKDGNGLEGRTGKVKILAVDERPEGDIFDISFLIQNGPQHGQTFGLTLRRDDFEAEPDDDQTIIRNLASWLRIDGATGLTTAVCARIKSAKFWK